MKIGAVSTEEVQPDLVGEFMGLIEHNIVVPQLWEPQPSRRKVRKKKDLSLRQGRKC